MNIADVCNQITGQIGVDALAALNEAERRAIASGKVALSITDLFTDDEMAACLTIAEALLGAVMYSIAGAGEHQQQATMLGHQGNLQAVGFLAQIASHRKGVVPILIPDHRIIRP